MSGKQGGIRTVVGGHDLRPAPPAPQPEVAPTEPRRHRHAEEKEHDGGVGSAADTAATDAAETPDADPDRTAGALPDGGMNGGRDGAPDSRAESARNPAVRVRAQKTGSGTLRRRNPNHWQVSCCPREGATASPRRPPYWGASPGRSARISGVSPLMSFRNAIR